MKDFIHLSRDKHGENFYLCATFLAELWPIMENSFGILSFAFEPVYSYNKHVSDAEESDLEENPE